MAGGRLIVSPLGLAGPYGRGRGADLAGHRAAADRGAGQVVDVDSLLLNTVGVALAHLAVVPAGRARLRRRQRDAAAGGSAGQLRDDASQGATPTIPRVGIAP